jgi:hypothetical protein
MTSIGYFCLGAAVFAVLGYLTGRFVVPREIVFPIPSWRIGRAAFIALTGFVIVRSCILFFTHSSAFRIDAILEAYADVTVISLAVVGGYDAHTMRHPKSIKGSLAIAPDGGLQIVDPFTDPTDVSLERKRKHS